jgi:transcriptional regulator with XRE-family HTH domain
MPRGIRIHGEAVRELRLARGWSQSLLAEHAGVSERTVRNAESGRVLGLHVAQCLALALGVSVESLFARQAPFVKRGDWEGLIRAFDAAYGQAILVGELDGLLDFTHSEIEWFCMTTPIMSFCGQFVGVDGLRSHCHAVQRFLRGLSVQARDPQYRTVLRSAIAGLRIESRIPSEPQALAALRGIAMFTTAAAH